MRKIWFGQVYNGSRSSGESPDMWMSRHEGLYELVMPKGEVEKVNALTEEQSLSDASDSLKALVNSSLLGARLFSFAIQDILSGQVDQVLKSELVETKKCTELKADTVRDMKKRIIAKIEEIENIETLVAKRTITVYYRSLMYKSSVASYHEQVELVCAACIRGWMVETSTLSALIGEDLVCGNDGDLKVTQIEEGMAKNAAASR
eukprot:6466697-Amphidinium_carterae.1